MKTTTLETSKLLKEAGYPQESYFSWVKTDREGIKVVENKNIPPVIDSVAAPTAEEILERLPAHIDKNSERYILFMTKEMMMYVSLQRPHKLFKEILYKQPVTNFVEPLGLMYLYLAKEGLLSQ